ncbi:hypothetical protein BGW37DRAFT_505495 [Umbelopsis sp. PMI_123]|nr:hypothetical protein BGW37DRAFT_505495 [Umbelopsis sp. PMI_123]
MAAWKAYKSIMCFWSMDFVLQHSLPWLICTAVLLGMTLNTVWTWRILDELGELDVFGNQETVESLRTCRNCRILWNGRI